MAPGFKLCIDPGHGNKNVSNGYDPGAQSGGHTEAGIVLLWSETLAWVCHLNHIPFWCTRRNEHDSDPVATRATRAMANGCTHFLALHCNAADTAQASGTETYYRDAADLAWSKVVHPVMLGAMESKDRGYKAEWQSQHSRLAVFSFDGPCALVEIGFITNPSERDKMLDRERRLAFANALASAILAM